jgi:ADP-heptose:LPS heptosyltransferase
MLWWHNPFIVPLGEESGEAELIDCHYPLIRRSNTSSHHFLDGFIDYLNERLGLRVVLTEFKGDIHLSTDEKRRLAPVLEAIGQDLPYWIVVAGGKSDFTVKRWAADRYQRVVDACRGRIRFVQVGAACDDHPSLAGVVDLRGRTTLRDLVQLVYHSSGVLTPVSLLMHLAAAVETKDGSGARPCVVVAGGREPPQWEAYPYHQFIHTVGTLPCCAKGGCWKARTVALGDQAEYDRPEFLCSDVRRELPHCMEMIRAEDVIRRIEMYLEIGA